MTDEERREAEQIINNEYPDYSPDLPNALRKAAFFGYAAACEAKDLKAWHDWGSPNGLRNLIHELDAERARAKKLKAETSFQSQQYMKAAKLLESERARSAKLEAQVKELEQALDAMLGE